MHSYSVVIDPVSALSCHLIILLCFPLFNLNDFTASKANLF
jgi:hypothetical protein